MAASQRDITEADDSGRKIVIIVAIVAAVIIAGLFYLLMRASSGRPTAPVTLQGAIRPGSPEWDKYAQYVMRDEPEADEAKRALGDIVMTLRTTVRNFTGKTLNGLEVRASVVNQQGKAIKETTVVVIPSDEHPELAPNKTVPVAVLLDGMNDGDDRANIKMEVIAFRIKP
jgi:hypothetical protein